MFFQISVDAKTSVGGGFIVIARVTRSQIQLAVRFTSALSSGRMSLFRLFVIVVVSVRGFVYDLPTSVRRTAARTGRNIAAAHIGAAVIAAAARLASRAGRGRCRRNA